MRFGEQISGEGEAGAGDVGDVRPRDDLLDKRPARPGLVLKVTDRALRGDRGSRDPIPEAGGNANQITSRGKHILIK